MFWSNNGASLALIWFDPIKWYYFQINNAKSKGVSFRMVQGANRPVSFTSTIADRTEPAYVAIKGGIVKAFSERTSIKLPKTNTPVLECALFCIILRSIQVRTRLNLFGSICITLSATTWLLLGFKKGDSESLSRNLCSLLCITGEC
jgi:hypothetical protein